MTIKPIKVFGALVLLGLMTSANAASISLVPTSNLDGVVAGDLVTFDIVADFTDRASIGGGFDIVFDLVALQFVSASMGPFGADFGALPVNCWDPAVVADDRCTVTAAEGLLESWVIAAFAGLDSMGDVGSLVFAVLPGLGAGTTNVGLRSTNGAGGAFTELLDPSVVIPIDYNQIAITGVPVPAAVWFLLSGLGVLFGIRRKA